jgi:hypothetical protein
MVGRARSQSAKNHDASREKAALEQRAAELYKQELVKQAAKLPSIGVRKVCKIAEAEHTQATGKVINLNHCTIWNRVHGLRSRAEANAQKGWLTKEETEVILLFIAEIGNRGFPLSHRRLKEHADAILRGRLGDAFPEGGVGKNWTMRFITKHSKRIRMGWASPLEEKRGRAVNPHTNDAWWALLSKTIKVFKIKQVLTWGSDEAGVNPSIGQRERVMGAKRKGQMYQQIGGGRENTTVIETICADGTALPPAVIFKGRFYQTSWLQANPANAS